MKSHSWKCRTFIQGVELFISIRTAQFITREELLFLIHNFTPCQACCPNVGHLSQLTGRLYKITWDQHMKTLEKDEIATIQDIFTGEEEPVTNVQEAPEPARVIPLSLRQGSTTDDPGTDRDNQETPL